jgi:hypothetical protein
MPMNRRDLLRASVAGAAILEQGRQAFAAPPANIQVAIDAAKKGEPINPMIFGGYMEPATTRVWSEMLSDRKFANPIVPASASAPAPANSMAAMMRRFGGQPFRPVGPAGVVEMDTVRPFVGKQSPRIKISGSEPCGIQASGLRVGKGKSYTGRVYLAGDPGAKVVVRLTFNLNQDAVNAMGAYGTGTIASAAHCLNPDIVLDFRIALDRHASPCHILDLTSVYNTQLTQNYT